MNERIKQLIKQLIKQATVPGYMLGESYVQSRLDEQKFAELIVKECAESLWTEECYNSDLALEEFEKNSKKIRKHFGVEL